PSPPTTAYYTLSLHDALPIWPDRSSASRPWTLEASLAGSMPAPPPVGVSVLSSFLRSYITPLNERLTDTADALGRDDHLIERQRDRKSTRLNSSHVSISYAVF